MTLSSPSVFPNSARVVVIGGGLAGLTAACDLADAGARVTLLESRRRLGGATFSFQRGDHTIDNGQHVLLRCCDSYRRFLDRLGTSSGIAVQNRFHLPVLTPDGHHVDITRSSAGAPWHLVRALSRYTVLSPLDRMRVLRATAALRSLDPDDPSLDDQSFGTWLTRHGQNERTLRALWNLIAVAALNCTAEQTSLALAAKVFRTAFLERADAADVGIPRWPLEELHVRPAEKYLLARGAELRTHAPVRGITFDPERFVVRLGDASLSADAVVLAVPPDAAAHLCPRQADPDPQRFTNLGTAPIINVHVIYERPVTDLPFAAAVSSPVQWVFDRTTVAGLTHGQYLTVSLSAAHSWIGQPSRQLRAVFLTELARLFPRAATTPVTDFFVTREHRATFRQVPGTARFRPDSRTAVPGLAFAGTWTATGWPDTMEGAVRSGHRAAEVLTEQVTGGKTG